MHPLLQIVLVEEKAGVILILYLLDWWFSKSSVHHSHWGSVFKMLTPSAYLTITKVQPQTEES